MEAGIIPPVALMVEAGLQSQPIIQKPVETSEAQKKLQIANANYMKLSQTRLVIETDAATGGWIYKTVDAKSGAVLAQYPLRSAWEIILSNRSGLGLMVDSIV